MSIVDDRKYFERPFLYKAAARIHFSDGVSWSAAVDGEFGILLEDGHYRDHMI